MTEIRERLQEIFRSTLENQDLVIEDAMTANDVDGWDSITHLDIIVNTENEFGIEISGFDVMGLQNIGDLLSLVENKLK